MNDCTWILIPSSNGCHWLGDCLLSLEAHVRTPHQVLLIDNASADGTQDFVRDRFPQVKVLPLAMNLGFTQATNLGMLVALQHQADSVVLLNNDTRTERDWLTPLRELAAAHPEFGLLGPLQYSFERELSPRTRRSLRNWVQHDNDLSATTPELVPVDWIEGSCLFIRRSVIEQIGYLDPIFAPAYYEETDYCRRARWNGFGVGLVTSAEILHHGAGTSQSKPASRQRERLIQRNHWLYHAAEMGWQANATWSKRCLFAARHLGGMLSQKSISPRGWLQAAWETSARITAVQSKRRRDHAGLPCPIEGTKVRSSAAQKYYEQCIREIRSSSLCPHTDTMLTVPLESAS